MPLEHIVKSGAIFLWTTKSKLASAFTIMKKWGFEYKDTITWVKLDGF